MSSRQISDIVLAWDWQSVHPRVRLMFVDYLFCALIVLADFYGLVGE